MSGYKDLDEERPLEYVHFDTFLPSADLFFADPLLPQLVVHRLDRSSTEWHLAGVIQRSFSIGEEVLPMMGWSSLSVFNNK